MEQSILMNGKKYMEGLEGAFVDAIKKFHGH